MNLAMPISSVVPGVAGMVLSVLARSDQAVTGRMVAELTRGSASQTGVAKALAGLTASGLVTVVPAGRASLYSLNREHLAYEAIRDLVDLRSTLFGRISESVAAWQYPAVSVSVFGSTVRGDATSASDVDLLVIRPDAIESDNPNWAQQVEALSTAVLRWTGNNCDILEYATNELDQLIEVDDPLITGLRRDAFTVAGADVNQLLKGSR
jgi:predicted nucleotidyltransferase